MTLLKVSCLLLLSILLEGCHLPGKPGPGDIVPRPTAVTSFRVLYGQNCAGCHGADGQNGAATNLANPEYEALVDDASLRDIITKGEPGSLMPAFGISSGGSLTPRQVDALIHGMRSKWGTQGNVLAGQNAPAYKATLTADPGKGSQVYAAGCARCHGAPGEKPGPAGNILDGSLLALVDAQMLRTTIIAGRPDIGQPDFRGDVPGHALTDAEVTDLTAWMLAQRPADPGQPYSNREPPSQSQTQLSGPAQTHAPSAPSPGQSRNP
jgi:cytochrome c oxidase cbb3-type subunit 3/ubiquinol-cytochrome c reductase cytochrome c subunit